MLLLRRKLKKMLLIHKVLGKIEAWVDRINVVLYKHDSRLKKGRWGQIGYQKPGSVKESSNKYDKLHRLVIV